ncbi:MAG: SGNH hydrolase domain-containing protein, partial [Actinomycetota bacterium]
LLVLSMLPASPALSAEVTPPGTASQIAQLVSASTNQTALSSEQLGRVAASASDIVDYRDAHGMSGCSTITSCVLGDPSASQTVVLFGDSHALMWAPPLDLLGKAHSFKVVLLWLGRCPVAAVKVFAPKYSFPKLCDAFRSVELQRIISLKPSLVVLAELTAGVAKPGGGTYTSQKAWSSALLTSLTVLKQAKAPLVILEDGPTFKTSVPVCLSRHPRSVQSCAQSQTGEPASLYLAERQAAALAGVTSVPTRRWLCAQSCSPVIGSFLPYQDTNHLTATYARFLTNVLGATLLPRITSP